MNTEIRIKIKPDRWDQAALPLRRDYLTELGQVALEVKRRELLAGLDKDGRPMAPLHGLRKDQANGPPLCPHGEQSRTIRLLDFDIDENNGEILIFWHDGWDKILAHHAAGIRRLNGESEPVRDVFGISPRGLDQIQQQARTWWQTRGGKT